MGEVVRQGPDEIRREDLEDSIREALNLIKALEDTLRLSPDPVEKERIKRQIAAQRELLQGYQEEYARLTGAAQQDEARPVSVAVFPKPWIAQLPYPIAAPCNSFNEAEDNTARFLVLDKILRNTVKYLAAIALAQYRAQEPKSSSLRSWVQRLSRRHLSEWVHMIEEIGDYYKEPETRREVVPVLLFDAYQRPLVADMAMAVTYQELCHRLAVGVLAQPTVANFIRELVAYRERTWEAGVEHLPPGFVSPLISLLQPAIRELLDGVSLFRDYQLFYAEHLALREQGVAIGGARWRGSEPVPTRESYESPTHGTNLKQRRLYLCNRIGEPLLNLHPLLIHHQDKLYFLEAYEENEELIFRPTHGGEILPLPQDLYASLASIFQPLEEAGANIGASLDEIEDAVAEWERVNDETSRLTSLLLRLNPAGREALEIALGEALRIGHFWLGAEFLLMGLSKQRRGIMTKILNAIGVSGGDLRGAIRGMVGVRKQGWREQRDVAGIGAVAISDLQEADSKQLAMQYSGDELPKAVITPRMMTILQEAVDLARDQLAGPDHLLAASLKHHRNLAVNLLFGHAIQAGFEPSQLERWVNQGLSGQTDLPDGDSGRPAPAPRHPPPIRPGGGGLLGQLGRDLNALAKEGKLRPAIGAGAHQAMLQIVSILQQAESNNPILLGDAGVGKTAIIEGLAWRLVHGAQQGQPVVPQLAGWRIIDLSPGEMVAGTKYRGDLEERVKQLLDEVRAADGQTIVFIDEIHTILGGGAEGSLGRIADILKPALARGEFPCIGATTVREYRRYIEKDKALARRFQPVWVEEPSPEEAMEIVTEVVQHHLAPKHGVSYLPAAVREAVELSIRYLHEEFLPGKAIKLLDAAGPRVLLGGSLRGAVDPVDEWSPGGIVTPEMIREIISERTGIPLARLSEDETQHLLKLHARLQERVIGQDEAVAEVARVIRRARAGLADPDRPLGVFLLAGPTGTGKTALALALADALFGEEDAIKRLDMSEYMEKHQVSRLVGAPPGYVGYEEEGQLTSHLRRHPYSVVLLDEIEKAHQDVQHLFLQLFDAGRLTDSHGHLADGRHAIFVMTTNLGAKEAIDLIEQRQPYRQKLQAAIETHFSAEFLNRVDSIVYFETLSEDVLLQIFDTLLFAAVAPLANRNITVEVSPTVKKDLCHRYTDNKKGARDLRRGIEREIIDLLTDALLKGKIRPGMKVTVNENGLQTAEKVVPNAGPPDKSPGVSPQRPAGPGRVQQNFKPQEAEKGRRLAQFDAVFAPFQSRLEAQGIKIEVTNRAQAFLCDPFWTSDPLETALAQKVESPLLERVAAGDFVTGDWVLIDLYAGELEFNKKGEVE